MTKPRAVLALIALAAAVLTIGLATPAQAGFDPCPDGPHAPPCADYLLVKTFYNCDGCPEWGLGFDETQVLAQDVRWRYIDDVSAGLSLLDKATRANNPDELRYQALKQFTAAASTLAGAVVKPGAVGVYDRGTGKFEPQPMPWLATADIAIADGLNGLASGPTPQPAVALKPFDEALAALTQAG
jgi:hypothetical protein